MSNKTTLFIKEVTARLTGDTASATAARNARKALAAFDSQLAGLASKKVDLEDELEQCEENLRNATFPTSLISDGKYYLQNINSNQQAVNAKKQELADLEHSVKYFTEKKKEIFAEVEA